MGPLLAPFDTTCVGRLSRERSKTGPASANPRIGPFNARRVFAIINIRDTGNPGPRGRLDSLNETVADVHRTGRRRRKGCIKNGTAKQPVSPERFREEFLKGVGMDRFSVIILEIGKRNGKRFFDITRQRHMLVYIYIYAFLLERTSSFDSRLEFHGFPGKCALPAPYLRPEEINQA